MDGWKNALFHSSTKVVRDASPTRKHILRDHRALRARIFLAISPEGELRIAEFDPSALT
jgi:hypothetical protein